MSKDEINYIYNTLIHDLLKKLSLNRKCDHYFREISALKLLGIKNADLPTYNNYSYCLDRYLSDLDNGNQNRKVILTTLAWLISEYTKNPINPRMLMHTHHRDYVKKRRASMHVVE